MRSGGHGLVPVEDGVVIDLAEFTSIEVGDDDLVTVGGGARWGDIAAALAPHGLGISSGDARDVGVGRLTLGGGVGWLVRVQGLAVDSLREVELVTAAGDVLTVNAESHPDLFWAVRVGAATSASSPGSSSRRSPPTGSSAGTSRSTRPMSRP